MRIPGSWTIARPFGVPVRIHWSVPVCALLAGGFAVAPGAWLAYLLLVLFHEAGHAFVVRRVGARATALDILGFGGLCWWEGEVTALQRACIAWGGIWAQMIIFAVTGIAVLSLGRPANGFANQMVDVALVSNLWLIGVNLLPIPPLDGKDAWTLFPLLRRRLSRRIDPSLPPALQRALSRSGSISVAPAERPTKLRVASPTRSVGTPSPSGGRVRVVAPHLDRRAIESPSPHDDFDESSFTPEAEAVIERARAIAREAARDPGAPPTAAGSSREDGPSAPRDPKPQGGPSGGDRGDGSP